MTLCFLGYHPERAIERSRRGHGGSGPRPVEIRLEADPVAGAGEAARGCSRSEGQSGAASVLQAELSERLVAARFYKPEKREFWTHVTVARVRSERRPRGRGGAAGQPMRVECSAGGAPCRAHAALRSRSGGALSLVFAALGADTCRWPSRICRSQKKGDEEMAQEKKANLKAADEGRRQGGQGQGRGAQGRRDPDRARSSAQGSLMRLGDAGRDRGRGDPDRRAVARPRARRRRRPARPDRRDLRPRVVGEDDARLPHHRRGPGARRGLRVRRRRARDRPDLREADRRRHRRAARLPARLRRAGARDRRRADPLRAPSTSSRSTRSRR